MMIWPLDFSVAIPEEEEFCAIFRCTYIAEYKRKSKFTRRSGWKEDRWINVCYEHLL